MGKIITVVKESVKVEVPKLGGTFERSFIEFLLDSMNAHGPCDSLERIDTAIQIVRKIKDAKAANADSITFEDEEFKVLDKATKSFMPTLIPMVAFEYRGYYRALEDKNVQTVDLATKK